jgi:L-ascorbate metabolism protein UlaG (beta-lactamase superfamily)
MQHTHTTPEDALRLFEALGARRFVAMHWGTFDLGDRAARRAPRRIEAEARRRGPPPDRVRIARHGRHEAGTNNGDPSDISLIADVRGC